MQQNQQLSFLFLFKEIKNKFECAECDKSDIENIVSWSFSRERKLNNYVRIKFIVINNVIN